LLTITLPPDIEQALVDYALKQGTKPELLVLDSLRERFMPFSTSASPAEREGTLADFLGAHIGVLHSSEHIPGGARLSEDTGRKFAAGMIKKRQQGRL
jgi:hypothetical protein